MNDGVNPTPKPSNRSRSYFVIGTVLLFVMAFTWALDSSFVYTSLGAAVFFFFLAFYNRPSSPPSRYQNRAGQYSSKQYSSPRKDIISEILDSLKGKSSSSSRQRQKSPAQQAESGRKFAMLVLLFIGSIFIIIILAVFFADDSTMEGELSGDYEKAEQARYAGNYDSAEFYYRKALTNDPENLDALNGLGILSLNQQRYDQAVRQFDEALAIDPDYEFARYNKALTLYYQHNYRTSLKETFELLERSPDYYDAMQLAGDNYYDQQRYDSAKFWYDQGYDLGVRNAWICHVLGYLYDRNNETDRAISLYQEALSYDSSKVDVYVRLGEMFPGQDGDFYRRKAAQLKQ